MKVGDTKVIEWVPLGVSLEPHQRLAQEKRVIASHNHYSVMVESDECQSSTSTSKVAAPST